MRVQHRRSRVHHTPTEVKAVNFSSLAANLQCCATLFPVNRFASRFATRWGPVSKFSTAGVGHLAEDEKTNKQSSFEHVKVLLPALSLVAYILTQLSDKHPTESKLLLGLTIFLAAAGYYRPLKLRFTRWFERRRDNIFAKNAYPTFREFVHRFGEFVDSRFNSTLHSIVLNELRQGRADRPAAFTLPNMELWHGPWLYFAQRIDRQNPRMSEFLPALMEFHLLISTYNNHCVTPILENLPPNLRAEIPPGVKSSLNSFQQRFERFVGEYQDFAKSLSQSRPILQGVPYWFNTPKPLS